MTASRGIRVPRGTRAAWLKANEGCHFCECGCGSPIPLKAVHFNVGIPRWLHGHNPGPAKQPKPVLPCACGCGKLATAGRRYISGHNSSGRRLGADSRALIAQSKVGDKNPQHGKQPHNYKGRQLHSSGYIMIPTKGHPFGGTRSAVMEHRLTMENHLREHQPGSPFLIRVDGVAYLRPDIEVHHINGVKDDNRIENLQPMTKAEHCALHRDDLQHGRWPNR
jgi:hypothetical protein